jgi:transcriptional regulator with XRE-family HTH domain
VARKTIRARRLGKQIRELREAKKLGQEALAEAISVGQRGEETVSQGHLSRIESGARRLTASQLERIIAAVSADSDTAMKLQKQRARAEELGWWSEYSPLMTETLELVVELGEDASTMRTYDAIFVQGLVQTRDYARAVVESSRAFVRPTEVDTLVELRMRRQKRLAETSFQGLTAVITEASLRHIVGSRAIQRAQLEKLCEVTEEGSAAVHVLRNDQGPWPGVGCFIIFGFPEEENTEVVHVDGDIGAGVFEDREPVKALSYTFDAALAKALPVRESLDLYREVMNEL